MHIPRSGFLASVAESSRSIALILGLLTRVAALGIAAVMAITVAMLALAVSLLHELVWQPEGRGFEYHILAFGIAVALMIAR